MSDPFEGWAIVELMGRRRLGGYVAADAPLLQATRLRIDIYDGDAEKPGATQYVAYPVYCFTPCTEELARAIGAQALKTQMPVAEWELPARKAIGTPRDDDDPAIAIAIESDKEDPWSGGDDEIDPGAPF